MADQFDVSPETRALLESRARRRAVLREEFLKKSTDPFRHGMNEGGTVFDANMQRFTAMRVSSVDHFRATPRTALYGLAIIVIPMFGYAYALKTTKDKKEAEYRAGLVPYSERLFKFV